MAQIVLVLSLLCLGCLGFCYLVDLSRPRSSFLITTRKLWKIGVFRRQFYYAGAWLFMITSALALPRLLSLSIYGYLSGVWSTLSAQSITVSRLISGSEHVLARRLKTSAQRVPRVSQSRATMGTLARLYA